MGYTTVDTTAGGQTIKVLVPTSGYVGRCVIYCHGRTELASHLTSDADKAAIVTRLTDEGYLLAASDAAGDNWGNQAAQDSYDALRAYLDTNHAPGAYAFWAQSMGGLAALLLAARGFTGLVGVYGAFPVCSLANMFNGNVGTTYPPSIRTAYGIASDGSDYSTKTAGFDPLLKAASLYRRMPMRFVASAGDTKVNKAANSDAMSAHVAAQLVEHDVITHTGDHGDASVHKPQDVSDFMARCFVGRSMAYRSV